MKLDERVTVRMSGKELSWFQRYADEKEQGVATAIREALGFFMQAFYRQQAVTASQNRLEGTAGIQNRQMSPERE